MNVLDLRPGITADLSRLKTELRALGGVLREVKTAIRRGLHLLEIPEEPWTPAPMPDEHLVSYA